MHDLQIDFSENLPVAGARILQATTDPRYYWRLSYLRNRVDVWTWFIGVNHSEIAPVYLETPVGVLIAGVEQGVFSIDIKTGALVNSITDASYVQSIERPDDGPLLVSAEDQLFAFSDEGRCVWRINLPDIIQDVKKDSGLILIEDVSGNHYRLDATTGHARDLHN